MMEKGVTGLSVYRESKIVCHFMPQDLKFGHHQGSEEKSQIEIFPSKMLSSIL